MEKSTEIDQIAASLEWTPEYLDSMGVDGEKQRSVLCEIHNRDIKAAIEKATNQLQVDLENGRQIHNAACSHLIELERDNARILKDHDAMYRRWQSRAAQGLENSGSKPIKDLSIEEIDHHLTAHRLTMGILESRRKELRATQATKSLPNMPAEEVTAIRERLKGIDDIP